MGKTVRKTKNKKQKNYIVLKQTKNIPNARVPSDEKINHGKINLYSRLTGVVEIKPGMNVAFKFSPLILKASLLTETSRCLRYLIYISGLQWWNKKWETQNQGSCSVVVKANVKEGIFIKRRCQPSRHLKLPPLTLYFPEVINMQLLPVISVNYPLNR